ncbi:fibronectin type III domain-containing protein [Psychroserpens sp.]
MNKIISLILVLTSIFSCDDITEIEDISNEYVVILAPTDNSILAQNDITFSWNALEEVDNYHIQIATPDFENATQIVVDSLVIGTNLSNVLSVGDYQWRVRAENSGYQSQYTTQNFSIEE